MSDQKVENLERVLARKLAVPLTTDELAAVSGGSTAYPCGDNADRITRNLNHQSQSRNDGIGDCS